MTKKPKIHFRYKKGTLCRVEGCTQPAEYEVYLRDVYPPPMRTEFYEQDNTCPFLCEKHFQEDRKKDPQYTNKHVANGTTEYRHLREAYPHLYKSTK
jgi:hypothetical protein